MFHFEFSVLHAFYLLVAFILYKIFSPLYYCLYYKRLYGDQVIIKFIPLLGVFGLNFKNEALRGDSLVWVRELVQQNPKAKIIATNFQFQPQLTIIDKQYAKEILTTHAAKYRWTDLLYGSSHFLDMGLVATHGEKWKQQRKILSNAFHFDSLRDRVPFIKDICKQSVSRLKKPADGKQRIDILREMQIITGEVIVRTFFGKSFQESSVNGFDISEAIASFILDATAISMDPYYSLKRILLGKKLAEENLKSQKEKDCLRKVEALRKVAQQTIEERIKDYKPDKDKKKDFLDFYLEAYLNPESQPKITIDEIVHQFITFYFAGMDTTANLASKLVYMLPCYPEVYKKIQQEIDLLVPNCDEIQHEHLSRLPETQAYIQEVLRYSSPAYILGFREVIEDFNLGDVHIPKGMVIDINFHAIHRSPQFWESPDNFNQERFKQGTQNQDLDLSAYLPFGSGQRNCIGQHLAQIEARIIMIYFLKNFKIHWNEDAKLRMGSPTLYAPLNKDLVSFTILNENN